MPGRSTVQSETRIDASPQRVWDVVGATSRYAEWVVNTLEVIRADAPAAHPGVTYDERNRVAGPWRARSRWRVLSAEACRHTIHAGEGIPLARDLRLELWLEPDGASTRYRHALSYVPALGPVGALVDRVVRRSLQRDVERTVANLKALVEGGETP